MTQQIIHDIMLAQGWNPPGTLIPLPFPESEEDDPVKYAANSIRRMQNREGKAWWKQRDDGVITSHGLPDTIDAAVGVIEGAGYRVSETYFSTTDESYSASARRISDNLGEITVDACDENDNWVESLTTLKAVLFKLALACVKQGKGPLC